MPVPGMDEPHTSFDTVFSTASLCGSVFAAIPWGFSLNRK